MDMNIIKDIDLLEFTAKQESQSLRAASDFKAEVLERRKSGVSLVGDPMPWEKTKEHFRFRESEVTLWAGVNGSGKSLVMGQCANWLMRHTGVVIASLEMAPATTLDRMERQASGCEQPAKQFTDYFYAQTQNLWVYDQTDSVPAERILAMCHWAATECGVKHIMIDSLVKCGMAPDDYSGQSRFMDALCWVAKRYKVHIHLVHHIRKGENDLRIPTKWDIKGAGELTDLADNVIIVAHNKRKDREIEDGADASDLPDKFLRIEKQRNGEFEDTWGFWFHNESLQWVPKPNYGALPWPSYEERYENRH
jgi:twinkle protein